MRTHSVIGIVAAVIILSEPLSFIGTLIGQITGQEQEKELGTKRSLA